ncbi:hypothetical protein SmaMPs15_000057 [Stenotrophomonas maltophilia phage vB_SmaM_Ps15]|uniref:Uncharacterized protein n=1 Tax=Stenotrophomonas maltophilia phage vB_SmaM_Ps15 TaxID=3071007 RepID=A0AAE9JU81_9CAUD|nr:hypothetical protein PQC01_gp057 [Stenotrophomonas maltophilia phage vB_SmaM_Ps15]UMO77208.1 hypothetical protein SmaMPs15_000057 [Stenotrophomonas maltophilia phage vB_SmaM_Ps15]
MAKSKIEDILAFLTEPANYHRRLSEFVSEDAIEVLEKHRLSLAPPPKAPVKLFQMFSKEGYTSGNLFSITEAVGVGFGFSIDDGDISEGEALARFDSLKIGESLVDEDLDTWTRVEDFA